ncbi:hypothetical protein BP00DRAFT_53885 [Aspergillus indologenus CBS 114.80]|uniref:Uncharacterized protein n=1 Tax=Aspergillus indologenus CBS 114.80 TaxID=1450541 RepID=A0A2V5J0L0_9EURO|nr:hypothetical protein BP00DRAFT_53885 [Aspergillus indologenus CBS 114.80]
MATNVAVGLKSRYSVRKKHNTSNSGDNDQIPTTTTRHIDYLHTFHIPVQAIKTTCVTALKDSSATSFRIGRLRGRPTAFLQPTSWKTREVGLPPSAPVKLSRLWRTKIRLEKPCPRMTNATDALSIITIDTMAAVQACLCSIVAHNRRRGLCRRTPDEVRRKLFTFHSVLPQEECVARKLSTIISLPRYAECVRLSSPKEPSHYSISLSLS